MAGRPTQDSSFASQTFSLALKDVATRLVLFSRLFFRACTDGKEVIRTFRADRLVMISAASVQSLTGWFWCLLN